MVTRLRDGQQKLSIEYSHGQDIFPFSKGPRPSLGSSKLLYNENIGGSFVGLKTTGCETDHTRPRKMEVRNEWSYTTSLPHPYTTYTCITLIFNVIVSLFGCFVLPKSIRKFHTTESSAPTYHAFLFPVLT
jgi:hypothetical protein